MSPFSFSSWPPALSDDQLQALTIAATTYALSHGLIYLPALSPQPPIPSSAIHAPLSLFPSPFPRRLFALARRLQSTYNILYARIASDVEFLDKVMGAVEGVGKVDTFVGQLWTGWKALRDEGGGRLVQPLQLGLFRSDYLLHASDDPDQPLSLKQVEFNTISSSFGTLSERTAALHRYLYASTGYYDVYPDMKATDFPPNDTTAGLVEGLVAAHTAYGVKQAKILFVVQAGERNVFDQKHLEDELLEKHAIRVVRQTFAQLSTTASVDPTSHALLLSLTTTPTEISVVYFRAGYTPTDYPTPSHYTTRFLLERSRAIKCPSIALQLAGGKRVQQVLAEEGVVERFFPPSSPSPSAPSSPSSASPHNLAELRANWQPMSPLSLPSALAHALSHAPHLVLKPQREGGGNNVYRAQIPRFLDGLPEAEREAWIAMELIEPPGGVGGYLVRAGAGAHPNSDSDSGKGEGEGKAVRADVVSELGVFGWALFGEGGTEIKEREVGWLVRTKGRESDEGGVATGFSVLDSVLLVDD